jgi:hypothetical protein
MSSEYIFISPITDPDYRKRIAGISNAVWPEFMLQDPFAYKYWDRLFEYYPKYQFALMDNKNNSIVGMANSLPISWDKTIQELPEEGWDWALETGIKDKETDRIPTLTSALQISILPFYRQQGLSSIFLLHMREIARNDGFTHLIAPVRPTNKQNFPLSDISNYMTWKQPDGLPYDPWLRVHVKNGAYILKPCKKSMTITGEISEWQKWTGLRFFETGQYVISGALVPINIDLEKNTGIYVEPNVWVVHNLSKM